jgi:hypothetical protein
MNTNVAPATTPALRPAGRERACAQCSTVFEPYRAAAPFCSSQCRVRAHRGVTTAVAGEARPRPCNASEPAFWQTEDPASDEGPQYIQSAHGSHRIYPRTYAEHGLPLPDYLKVQRRFN